MRPLHICYFAHHGTTRLFIEIHKIWAQISDPNEFLVDNNPSFIVFNPYWVKIIRKQFPDSSLMMLPLITERFSINFLNLVLHPNKSKNVPPAFGEEFFKRGMNLDKIFRHRRREYVKHIWNETIRRTEKFLDEQKPDFIISEAIQTMYCYAIFLCATKRKIPYIHLASGRIKEYQTEIYNDLSNIPFGFSIHDELRAETIKEAQLYLDKIQQLTYRTPLYNEDTEPLIKIDDIKKFIRYFSEYIQGGCLEEEGQGIFHTIFYKLRALWFKNQVRHNKKLYKGIEDIEKIPKGYKKLLFPLHVTPEASTDLWAPEYNDMPYVAESIAKNLPDDWYLIIKEHPAVLSLQRKLSEIKKLSNLPKSILVSPHVPNDYLAKKCSAYIVIASTFGMEMMLRRQPVITLANPIYDITGNTIPCKNFQELPYILKNRLGELKYSEEKNITFLASFIRVLADGFASNADMYPETMTQDNINRLAESLKNRVLLNKKLFVDSIERGLKII